MVVVVVVVVLGGGGEGEGDDEDDDDDDDDDDVEEKWHCENDHYEAAAKRETHRVHQNPTSPPKSTYAKNDSRIGFHKSLLFSFWRAPSYASMSSF